MTWGTYKASGSGEWVGSWGCNTCGRTLEASEDVLDSWVFRENKACHVHGQLVLGIDLHSGAWFLSCAQTVAPDEPPVLLDCERYLIYPTTDDELGPNSAEMVDHELDPNGAEVIDLIDDDEMDSASSPDEEIQACFAQLNSIADGDPDDESEEEALGVLASIANGTFRC